MSESLPDRRPPSKIAQLGFKGRDVALAKSIFPRLTDSELLFLFTMGARLGLNPALGHLVWIDGKPAITREGLRVVTSRQIVIKDKKQEWRSDEEGWVDFPKRGSTYARCTIRYKRTSRPGLFDEEAFATATISLAEFTVPQRQGKKPGPWQEIPLHMLMKVAESNCLREAMSDILGGIYSTDEATTYVADYEGEHVDEEELRQEAENPGERDAGDEEPAVDLDYTEDIREPVEHVQDGPSEWFGGPEVDDNQDAGEARGIFE